MDSCLTFIGLISIKLRLLTGRDVTDVAVRRRLKRAEVTAASIIRRSMWTGDGRLVFTGRRPLVLRGAFAVKDESHR